MTTARQSALVALGVASAVAAGCAKSNERERLDFERMRVQQRFSVYEPSAVFANGEIMQPPPPGTLTLESVRDTGAARTGMAGGRYVAAVPIAMTADRLARGRERFTVYCAVCHGAGAFGGSIVAENMGQPRAPSLRSAAMLAQPAGYVYNVATNGKGRMPSYASQLTPDERWAVVAYVQQLQHAPAATDEQRADSLRAVEIQGIDSALARERRP